MAKKHYPLEVESVGTDTYIVMSKGHHNFEEFMAAVNKEYADWKVCNPVHRWVKSVPDRSGPYHMRYVFVPEGTPGAWPATYAQE